MKKQIIIKGGWIGSIIFIITETVFSIYTWLINYKLVPEGTYWSPMAGFLTFTWEVVRWITHPFSSIFWVLGGKKYVLSSLILLKHLRIFISVFDLVCWVGLIILILYIRDKRKLHS